LCQIFLFSFEIKISSSSEHRGIASVVSVFCNPYHNWEIIESLNKKLIYGTYKSCSGTPNFCIVVFADPPGSRTCGLWELKSLPWKHVDESLKPCDIMIVFQKEELRINDEEIRLIFFHSWRYIEAKTHSVNLTLNLIRN
jgi:hypothetical protein